MSKGRQGMLAQKGKVSLATKANLNKWLRIRHSIKSYIFSKILWSRTMLFYISSMIQWDSKCIMPKNNGCTSNGTAQKTWTIDRRHRNDSWRIKVMHWHEQAYREQWSALFSHASLQTSLPLGSIQPLLRDNQQLHVRMKTWSRQLGWSGNTGPTADKQEKGKQISIIDSTIIKALWYMKLNQMMQKRAWRSQHVSTEGTSRQMALCEGKLSIRSPLHQDE